MTASSAFSPYRTPDTPPIPAPPSYVEHWREYRKRMWHFVAAWLGALPVFALILVIVVPIMAHPMFVLVPAFGVYWVLLARLYKRGTTVLCPRCGKLFYSNGAHSKAWLGRCLHCDLPRGAPCDPDWKGDGE